MSTEQSRLRSAIQRIAKEDPDLRGAIEAAKSRGDQPGGTGVGESDGERDRICCDGSTSDNANPGTDARDTSDGGQDGLDPNDPANLESAPGELAGVVDCATGQPICLDGDGFIPPEGWDDPAVPPVDATYKEGFFWSASDSVGSQRSATLSGMEAFGNYDDCFISCAGSGVCVRYGDSVSPIMYQCGTSGYFDKLRKEGENLSGGGTGYTIMYQFSCEGSQEPYCHPSETDLVDLGAEWPADGCVNLAIIGGKIVGSKYDPENDGSYSAPRDEIELCDPETGDSILIRPSSDGGWKSIESLDGDIDPETGNGYLYAPDGKRIRQISPSEFRDDMV